MYVFNGLGDNEVIISKDDIEKYSNKISQNLIDKLEKDMAKLLREKIGNSDRGIELQSITSVIINVLILVSYSSSKWVVAMANRGNTTGKHPRVKWGMVIDVIINELSNIRNRETELINKNKLN